MAKKRKKDKEPKEDYEFTPPDFDEREFLGKEMRDIRTSLLTILLAVLFGAVAGAIAAIEPDLALVGLIIVIAGLFALPTIYKLLRIDTSGYQKKNWAGNIGTFFFTFLAIWVLLINPPFADLAKPSIDDLIIWIDHEGTITSLEYVHLEESNLTWGYYWVVWNTTWPAATIHLSPGDTVNITARIADNGKLVSADISFDTQNGPFHAMTDEGDNRFGLSVAGDYSTTWSMYFRAVDDAGNSHLYHPSPPPLST